MKKIFNSASIVAYVLHGSTNSKIHSFVVDQRVGIIIFLIFYLGKVESQ